MPLKYITYGTYKVIRGFNSDGLVLTEGDKLKVVDIWKADKAVCFYTIEKKQVVISYEDLERYIERESIDTPTEITKPIFGGIICFFERTFHKNRNK